MIEVPLPDMPAGPSPEELIRAGLRKRYLELAAQAYEISVEVDRIKERFRQLGPGQYPVGDGGVTVSPNNRFDQEQAEKVLRAIHPELVEKCSVSRIDSTLTKQHVSGEVYAQCQVKAGDDKVSIK